MIYPRRDAQIRDLSPNPAVAPERLDAVADHAILLNIRVGGGNRFPRAGNCSLKHSIDRVSQPVPHDIVDRHNVTRYVTLCPDLSSTRHGIR
jgi:hypothetical protein